MHRNMLTLLGTTALVAVLAAPLAAQSQGRSQSQPQAEQSGQQRAQQQRAEAMTDQAFVREAAIVNMFEIRAGEIARDKAQDQETRDLAQQIVNDHQRMQDRLSQSARKVGVPSQLDQRRSNLIDRLERVSGRRFDQRFIRMQIQGHEQAIDHFERYIEARQEDASGSQGARSTLGQDTRDQTARGQGGKQATQQQRDASRSLLQYAQQNLPALRQHLRTAQSMQDRQQSPSVADRQSQQDQQQDSRDERAARRFVVEQPRPQVTVTDPRSQVNVQQPQPQVTVRQKPPTVTIEQPPPEIIVQMPRPKVDVQNREPRVSVNVPRPEVRVEQQGDSARVQVQRQASDEAQVQYERARPQVKFERSGEPRVVYRSTQEEPNVRYENAVEPDSAQNSQATNQTQRSRQERQSATQADRRKTSSQARQATDASQQAAERRASETDEDWRDRARELAGSENASSATTGSAASTPASGTVLTVGRIMDMRVYNARGQNLGEVEDIVVDPSSDRTFVILASGGFLGMFEDEVALPLERFSARADRLVIRGLSEEDIDNMQHWEDRLPNSQGLDENSSVRVGG